MSQKNFMAYGDAETILTGFANDIKSKQDIMQYSVMPTASASNVGKIVQYVGTTNVYTNGYFYKCIEDSGVYSWTAINVQGGASFSASITVAYPSGSTCTCVGGGKTQTATSNPNVFIVDTAGSYVVSCTDGTSTDSQTIIITTSGQSENVTLSYFTGSIITTYSNEFKGLTITCSDGITTFTQIAPNDANTVTFTVYNTGTWTISATYSGQVYSDTAVISALETTANATLSIYKTFATATDAEIASMVAKADAGEIDLYDDCGWRVGQEHTTTIGAISATGTFDGISWTVGEAQEEQQITLVLMHKGLYELQTPVLNKQGQSRTTCSFVVGVKDCLSGIGYINSTNTNADSWNGCARRNWCNGGFRSALSSDLRGAFKQFKTKTAETYNGSTIKTSVDWFALAAEKEVFGARTQSNETEANALTQFTWYEISTNRVKNASSTNGIWWERSPAYSTDTHFCFVVSGAGGTPSGGYTTYTMGISPFGCL